MCLTSSTLRPRYPNLVSLYSVLAILYVSHIHYSQTSFIRTTWCLSLLCTGHTVCVSHPLQSDLVYPNNLVYLYSVLTILCVLTSTTLRPRLSEQLDVSLLCTGHTVCVSHPLQSYLVYPNNLVSLYSVLTILYVSHIHYTQTSFIRTTWCLSTLY